MTFTKEERQAARDIASKLYYGFVWSYSKKGYEYWSRVYQNLLNVAYDSE